jgi:putative RecB family exonuclease
VKDTELTTWRLRLGFPASVPGKQGPPRGDLSASKVKLLDRCPLAYSFSKIDKLPWKPTDAMLRGSLVHRVLEAVARPRLHDLKAGKPSEGELREVMREEAAKGRFTTGVVTSAWAVLTELSDDLDFSRAVAVEENWTLEIPQDALAGPPFKLCGTFDRVDVHDDAQANGVVAHVHDYKSGSNVASVSEMLEDPQVQFYVAAIAQHWSGPIRVTFHFLGAQIPVSFLAPKDLAQRGLDLAMSKVAELRTRTAWEPFTGPHCVGCEFRNVCPAYKSMSQSRSEVFPVGEDAAELLREYVRCRTLAKLFDDHKQVCGQAIKAKLDGQERLIGGGFRAILSPREQRRLPDDPKALAEAIQRASGSMSVEEVERRITGVSEKKLKALMSELPADAAKAAARAVDELKEVYDASVNLDVRATAGGF